VEQQAAAEHIAPVEKVIWRGADGILYLKPEIVLTYKATNRRVKDDLDFDATLPILTEESRRWLEASVSELVPDQHWLKRLQTQAPHPETTISDYRASRPRRTADHQATSRSSTSSAIGSQASLDGKHDTRTALSLTTTSPPDGAVIHRQPEQSAGELL
jgi:hypothetical protein